MTVNTPWAVSADAVLQQQHSDPGGLSKSEAAARLQKVGHNRLPEPKPTPWWKRVLAQFNDVLIYILLGAAALKAVFGEWVDFSVILAVAVINAAVGLIQEGRAENALNAIRGMLSVSASVLRDGSWAQLDAEEVVPGDIVRVRPGDRVSADIRLIEAANLRVEESALTGESVPSEKRVDAVDADSGVGDRSSMLYSSTLVVAGSGTGVVVGTGAQTEIGRIQKMISEVKPLQTPLTKSLNAFGRILAVVILVLAMAMIIVGRTVHGFAADELVSAAVGFAVAAVPEGLPALVTITLALGVQQMARRNAIVRQLPAVETLGSVTVICSDKTGTLTQNEMTVRTVSTRHHEFDTTGTGYSPEGKVTLNGAALTSGEQADLDAVTEVMALCNDAEVVEDEGWHLVGEPTEGALRVLGLKAGVTGSGWQRLAEIPFDSETKYMATLVEDPQGSRSILVKGAPDRLLDRCGWQSSADGTPEPLERAFWEEKIDELGSQGLRVLAAARRTADPAASTLEPADIDEDLELTGVVGIVDPPRPEAVEAISLCSTAGIGVTMITGDHSGTALAIAREMGIVDSADAPVLTGAEVESMSDTQLRKVVDSVRVYARTSPEHKLRIVSALQHHGEVVAMTGDGVNDSPALRQSDVGVAMGIKGTEATKEAAEVVLADDNFATIERAVEEGRRIFDNLRKALLFLLPTNGAQSLVVFVAVLFGLTLPLQPTQVLWINLVTSVTLSLPLATEAAEAGVMRRPPRRAKDPLLTAAMFRQIVLISLLIGGAAMAVFYYEISQGTDLPSAQGTAVTMLALGQVAYLFSCRFLHRSSLSLEVFKGNRTLWWSVAAMIVLQLAFLYLPLLQNLFLVGPIGLRGWGLIIAIAVLIFLLSEAIAAAERAYSRRSAR